MSAPLTNLTKKNVVFKWGDGQETAFQALKAAIQVAPVLATPDVEKPFTVYVDASSVATGGVLLQHDANNQLHPIAYHSAELQPAERNYTIGELEMLAVVHALHYWKCFLEGAEFTIWTDHSNLTSFITSPTLNGRQSRWASFVQTFLPGMTIRYKRGAENMADALSRRPDYAQAAAATAPTSLSHALTTIAELSQSQTTSSPLYPICTSSAPPDNQPTRQPDDQATCNASGDDTNCPVEVVKTWPEVDTCLPLGMHLLLLLLDLLPSCMQWSLQYMAIWKTSCVLHMRKKRLHSIFTNQRHLQCRWDVVQGTFIGHSTQPAT